MNSAALPFWDHAADLRRSLLKSLCIIVAGALCAFMFYQEVFAFLTYPLHKVYDTSAIQHQHILTERIYNPSVENRSYSIPSNGRVISLSQGTQEIVPGKFQIPPKGHIEVDLIASQNHLIFLGPLDGIMTSIKTSFWIGLVGTSPLWILFIIQFIAPALHSHEKRLIFPFLVLSLLFLISGLLFAYFITIPAANHYLLGFNQEMGMNLWSVSNYLDFTLSLLLANAFAFEICIVLLLFVHYGILSAETLSSKRRHMIVMAFIIGAVLTPPDVFTQLMLAIPLILLYEIAILYARIKDWKRQRL